LQQVIDVDPKGAFPLPEFFPQPGIQLAGTNAAASLAFLRGLG
jgi:hypothetical protein